MEDGIFEEEMEQQTQQPTGKKKGTGAKKVLAAVGIVALLGGGIAATYFGIGAYKDYQETKRTESLVSLYMDKDGLVTLPDTVRIDKTYDAKYCTGEKLVSELSEADALYCYVDGQYFTEKGDKIAILSLEVTRTETIDATMIKVGNNSVFMAPEGYVLKGDKCTKETVTYETKVVPKNDKNDYTNILVEGASHVKLLNVQEVDTKPYSEMNGYDLIVDVPDGAQLNNDQTVATLRLVPRK